MKRISAIILIFMVLFTSLVCAQSTTQEVGIQSGFLITFNGAETEYSSVIYDNKHYLPIRKVFELMEAKVFFRSRDSKILTLTRDGDTITHIIGDNKLVVNGNEKIFENPSLSSENVTYISVDMFAAAMCPDRISYSNRRLNIEKQLTTNEYHKVIKDVLAVSTDSNFKPESFKQYKDFHAKYPKYTMQEVINRVNLGLVSPFYENIKTIEHPYELCVLVNKYNKLPSQFNQYNLVNMDSKYTLRDGKKYLLAGVAYDKYVQMWNDARKQGLYMVVVSAHRTEDYQRGLYNNKVRNSGKVYADAYSARPGHSEHQTGLAMDIGSTQTSFEYSAEFRWLQKHAHEYGYIMRYPKGKEWITGYAYEPWHYRYVGVDAATKMYEEGITFEEYHAKYKNVNEYK